jgi:hypothetical protein
MISSKAVTPIERFADTLLRAGIADKENELPGLVRLFAQPQLMFLSYFPCPKLDKLNPYTPAPGAGMEVHFYPDGLSVTYTIAVLDISVTPATAVTFDVTATNPPSPFVFTIPPQVNGVDVFQAGHDYMLVLYPSLAGIPIGCNTFVPVTPSSSSPFRKAIIAALAVTPQVAG